MDLSNAKLQYVTAVFAPYTGLRVYTYKTLLHVSKGDFAVVHTPTNGFQVVKIRTLDEPVPTFNCKWLVQKVDLSDYEAIVKLEKAARRDEQINTETEFSEALTSSLPATATPVSRL